MAVYTPLEQQEIAAFVESYGLGPLLSYEGIAEGIENTNYFVTTDESDQANELYTEPERHFVLTVFETLSAEQLGFYVELLTRLHLDGLPVPCPITDANGQAIGTLQHKPALLIPKMPGSHPMQPTIEQCQSLGYMLADLHICCLETGQKHPNPRAYDWFQQCAEKVSTDLNQDDSQLLREEVAHLQQILHQYNDLPTTIIHGDLFRDNTLFEDEKITAVIDFYSAGDGHLLMDLAVVVNDWCSLPNGDLDSERATAILDSYRRQRPLSGDEQELWNDFLRIAALRFWLSRLEAHQTHRPGGLTDQKDPEQYKAILLSRRSHPQSLT